MRRCKLPCRNGHYSQRKGGRKLKRLLAKYGTGTCSTCEFIRYRTLEGVLVPHQYADVAYCAVTGEVLMEDLEDSERVARRREAMRNVVGC